MSPKEAATLTARKMSSKDTFWLVLSTTPLLASLKGFTVFTFRGTETKELRVKEEKLGRSEPGEKDNQRRIGWPKLHVWVRTGLIMAYSSPQIWPLYSQKYSAKSMERTGPRRHRRT